MKKIIQIVLTIIFLVISIFLIEKTTNIFADDSLLLVALAFSLFAMHLFIWIAPKIFFNLCWKITNIMPDNFDYDTSYRKLELCDIGLLIISILLIIIPLLF
jgi:hypothetical protein